MALLEAKKLGISFGGLRAVDDFNISIEKGALYGLIGPNGAGKTTVFNLLTGVYKPTEGIITLDGKDITGKKTIDINQAGIARTFQNIRLFTNETVLENVMIGCHVRRKAKWWMAPLGLPLFRKEEEEIREKSMKLLEAVGLAQLANENSGSLPYGAQRRLEIARALATDPKFLLLDEPAAGMNPYETRELMKFIQSIRERFGITILLIEHDMKVVMGVCEYIWVLDYGVRIAEGNPDEIQSNKKVIVAYLGEEYVKYVEK